MSYGDPAHYSFQADNLFSNFDIVAKAGLGKDQWEVEPDQITYILYVRIISNHVSYK